MILTEPCFDRLKDVLRRWFGHRNLPEGNHQESELPFKEAENMFYIQVSAIAHPSGGLFPRITVVEEENPWHSVPIEVDERKRFNTEKEAISYGQEIAIEQLKKRFANAQFRITSRNQFQG